MKVVHLSTVDIGGGASRGSYALHQELVRQGVESVLVVEQQRSSDPDVRGDELPIQRLTNKVRHRLDLLPLRAYRGRRDGVFSLSAVPGNVVGRVRALNADLVHLHWVGASFVRPEDLERFGVPIVWTLRDMWPFTGGCHYSEGCDRYEQSCGRCPHLGTNRDRDLSRWVWSRKQRSWMEVDITPVAISRWTGDQARASSLFGHRDVRVIHNAIDVEFWSPQSKEAAKRVLNIPMDKQVVLFIALSIGDTRKGFSHFVDACRELSEQQPGDGLYAVVVGATAPADRVDLGVPAQFLGALQDDTAIRNVYAAADVTVVPSLEEAFGKTAAESLACGTPVVAFDSTGLAGVVGHKTTGYLAKPFEADDLASGVTWILGQQDRWEELSDNARESATERFSLKLQARKYVELYEEVLAADGRL